MIPQKIAFIINPKAGVRRKLNLEEFIRCHFPKDIDYDIIIWENKNSFDNIKQQLLQNNYSIAVACGGDGTVNQVASVVVNTNMALGILPLGSGNGLARSNSIPMDLKEALLVIAKGNTKKTDAATINSLPFFCTAGIGFDALIAHQFATSTKRGFFTYFKTSIKSYFSYKPKQYTLVIDGKIIQKEAFLITIANAGQWGNDVYIAPSAKLNDGILNISMLTPFTILSIPLLAFKLFSKKIHTSAHLHSFTGKQIEIVFKGELPTHFDGEPTLVNEKLVIGIQALALNVVC